MKLRSMISICMAVVITAGAFLSVPVSADTLQQGNNTIQISEAVRTLWAQNGISIADVQKAINRNQPAYIEDYGVHVYRTSPVNGIASAQLLWYYDVTDISYCDYITSGTTTYYNSEQTGNTVGSVCYINYTNVGHIFSLKASRASASVDINDNTIPFGAIGNDITIVGDRESLYTDPNDDLDWHWIPLGDVNADGSVDIIDFMALSSYLTESNPGSFYAERADVNLDGSVDTTDLSLILQYINKYISHIWGNT